MNDFDDENGDCTEKLDLIDNMLSNFETLGNFFFLSKSIFRILYFLIKDSDDENTEETPKALDERTYEPLHKNVPNQIQSPLLSDSTNRSRSFLNQPSSLLKLKRSQSFQTKQANCSTPKFAIGKELEFLNILYNDGSLNDSQIEQDLNDSKTSGT